MLQFAACALASISPFKPNSTSAQSSFHDYTLPHTFLLLPDLPHKQRLPILISQRVDPPRIRRRSAASALVLHNRLSQQGPAEATVDGVRRDPEARPRNRVAYVEVPGIGGDLGEVGVGLVAAEQEDGSGVLAGQFCAWSGFCGHDPLTLATMVAEGTMLVVL
jgi:hypothetical protein